MSGLHLPDAWYAAAVAHLDTGTEDRARIEQQRGALERGIERQKRLLLDGDITQADYRAEKSRIEAELALLRLPAAMDSAEHAATRLRDLAGLWEHATPEERRDLAGRMFEAIWCDLDGKRIIAVQMKRAFLPLKNALFGLSECGSDGIRTRGLLRDRQAC